MIHADRRRLAASIAFAAATVAPSTLAFAQGAPATQPPTSPPADWGGLNSGGLAPPAPLTPGSTQTPAPNPSQSPPSRTPPANNDFRADLDKSKDKDSGRGLSWFWVDAYGGFEHAGLQTFNKSEKEFSAGLVPTTASGGVIGAGIGAQIFFVTLGVRGRMGFFDAWQIGRIGGEVGFRFPLGRLEPHFDVGGGYAGLANLDLENVSIKGGYARANAGLDIYPVKVLSIGPEASFDFLGTSRSAVGAADLATLRAKNPQVTDAQAALLSKSGTGLGATFAIVGVIGIHL